ncbi:MAG: hypothetical protein M0R73_04510 [Dehalococcoidia bacterium]|nr:hypothetical protein [Dehalococcoidia bacterium]
MPRFQRLDPNQVVLGRGRANALKRRPYVEAIKGAQAGRIELDKEDDPAATKRLLRQASKEVGIKVRSSWEDDTKRALLWKRVGA